MVTINKNTYNQRLRNLLVNNKIIKGAYHSPGLGIFLKRDAPKEIFKRTFDIRCGALNPGLSLENGQKMKPIFGLSDLKKIFTAVKQEKDKDGNKIKVLYGWERERDWGNWKKPRIRYILAAKKAGEAEFKLERDPIPLVGLTDKQKMIRATNAISEAFTSELNDLPYYRSYKVRKREKTGKTFIICRYAGKGHEIDGFNGYKKVVVALVQESDQLKFYFHKNIREAMANIGCFKIAVVAEREQGRFVPLDNPRIVYSIPESKVQYQRIFINALNDYLISDKNEGDFFYLEPKQVDENGNINFAINSKSDEGGVIHVPGYQGYDDLYGGVVVYKDYKVAYFWPDAASRESFFHPAPGEWGAMPIKKEGHLFARKKDKWEIVFNRSTEEWRSKRRSTRDLVKYLFATVGNKEFAREYPVNIWRSDGRIQKTLPLTIRGRYKKGERRNRPQVIFFDLTAFNEVNGTAFLVGRELGGRFKLLEVWASKKEWKSGKKPLQACFATFRSDDRSWMIFKAKLNKPSKEEKNGKKYAAMREKFRLLINKKRISREELSAILSQDDLLQKHGEILYPLIDDLFVSLKKYDISQD